MKNMKKLFNIMILLMLTTSFSTYALADENPDTQQKEEYKIDERTQTEAEIMMKDNLGAEIRLLQLEKAIEKNILKGEKIISILKETGYNTTELEAILAELKLLKEEVQSAPSNSSDAVQIFVDLKSDAIEVTKDFKETLAKIVDEKTIEELREKIKEINSETIQNISKKIRDRVRQFNRKHLQRIFQLIGENNNSLLARYQKGNVTMQQVKQHISEIIHQMTREKRYRLFAELKENKIKMRIQAREKTGNLTQHFEERKEMRITKRLTQTQNIDDKQIRAEMEHRMRNRLNKNN